MSVVSVEQLPIASPLTLTDVNGALQMRYVQEYQVMTDDPTDSAFVVINAAALPKFNNRIVTVTGHELFCKMVLPKQNLTAKKKWTVTCTFMNETVHVGAETSFFQTFTNDPTIDPTTTKSRVRVTYETKDEEIIDATVIEVKHWGLSFPSWNRPPSMPAGPSKVMNSAGVSIPMHRPRPMRVFTVSKVYRDWSSVWDSLTGKVNSTAFTITRADDDGPRASYPFTARKMLMRNVDPREVWINGKLYFDVTFTMAEHPDGDGWIHKQIDEGTDQGVFVGQYRNLVGNTTSQYVADDVQTSKSPILSVNLDGDIMANLSEGKVLVPVVDPVPLNGYGAELGREAPYSYDVQEPFTFYWKIFPEADFSTLGM